MRIACLQFAPQTGDVDNNLYRADAILSRECRLSAKDLDFLVLPELAFSGANFESLAEAVPYMEPTGAAVSSLWTRIVALKYDCTVAVGYPERTKAPLGYHNSVFVVNREGKTIAHHRNAYDNHHACTSYDTYMPGFGAVVIATSANLATRESASLLALHIMRVAASVVLIPMAWGSDQCSTYEPQQPDMVALTSWVRGLEPLVSSNNKDEVIVVFANSSGQDKDIRFFGTSAVIGIHRREIKVYGILGQGEKQLLLVDTEMDAFAKLVETDNEESTRASHAPTGEITRFAPIERKPTRATTEDRSRRYVPELMQRVPEAFRPKLRIPSGAGSQGSHVATPYPVRMSPCANMGKIHIALSPVFRADRPRIANAESIITPSTVFEDLTPISPALPQRPAGRAARRSGNSPPARSFIPIWPCSTDSLDHPRISGILSQGAGAHHSSRGIALSPVAPAPHRSTLPALWNGKIIAPGSIQGDVEGRLKRQKSTAW